MWGLKYVSNILSKTLKSELCGSLLVFVLQLACNAFHGADVKTLAIISRRFHSDVNVRIFVVGLISDFFHMAACASHMCRLFILGTSL